MDHEQDMQRVLRSIEDILSNLGTHEDVERMTPQQASWKLNVTRDQLDNVVFNLRQRYPKR